MQFRHIFFHRKSNVGYIKNFFKHLNWFMCIAFTIDLINFEFDDE